MFTRPSSSLYMQMAERGGFEPPVHLCGHTHDFQSCSFGLSDISPASRSLNKKRKSNIRHAARDLENLRPVCIMLLIINNGGERGIRTPVGAFGPQIDFESIPLRPLRYLSVFYHFAEAGADVTLFSRKNLLIISPHSSFNTPSVTFT